MLAEAHDFGASLAAGRRAEQHVRARIEALTPVRFSDVSHDDDLAGIDCRDQSGRGWQIKLDTKSHTTGNVYVELSSNIEARVPGWACSYSPAWLAYYTQGFGRVYIMSMETVATCAATAWARFPTRRAKNKGRTPDTFYHSNGLLVPIGAFTAKAKRWLVIDEQRPPTKTFAESMAAELLGRYRHKLGSIDTARYLSGAASVLRAHDECVGVESLRRCRELFPTFPPPPDMVEDQCGAVEADLRYDG